MPSRNLESLIHLDDELVWPLRNLLRRTSAPAHWFSELNKAVAGVAGSDHALAATRTSEPFRCGIPLADVDPLAALHNGPTLETDATESVDVASELGDADFVDDVARQSHGSQRHSMAQPHRKKPGTHPKPKDNSPRRQSGLGDFTHPDHLTHRMHPLHPTHPDFHRPLPNVERKTLPAAQLRQMCDEPMSRGAQKKPDASPLGARVIARSALSAPSNAKPSLLTKGQSMPAFVPQIEVGAKLIECLTCAHEVEPALDVPSDDTVCTPRDVHAITRVAIQQAFVTPVQQRGAPTQTTNASVTSPAVAADLEMRENRPVQHRVAWPSADKPASFTDEHLVQDANNQHAIPSLPIHIHRPKPVATLASLLNTRVTSITSIAPTFALNDADAAGISPNHAMPPINERASNGLTSAMAEHESANGPQPALVPTGPATSPEVPSHAAPAIQNTFNVTVHMEGAADSNDELAERLARVLADQARRYGIDV